MLHATDWTDTGVGLLNELHLLGFDQAVHVLLDKTAALTRLRPLPVMSDFNQSFQLLLLMRELCQGLISQAKFCLPIPFFEALNCRIKHFPRFLLVHN